MLAEIMERYPLWLQAWVGWLGLVNLSAFAFVGRVQARWVLAGFFAGALLMEGLYQTTGFSRLLGLGHVVFWTPVLVYLIGERPRIARGTFRTWVNVVIATYATSLVVDYVDVARWVLGERG